MKRITLSFLLLLICNLGFAQKIDWQPIEKDLNKLLSVSKAVGFSVAVVKGKEVIYVKGFGYRNLEEKKVVDANTLFAIGSSSKAFTAAILGQLESENLLSLDDKPSKYIHDLSFFNDELNNKITIRDMMSHRTGLPRHDYSWYLFPTFNSDSLLQRVAYLEPSAGIREKWMYNNFMYLAQGVLAERITKKSWSRILPNVFLHP